jgi:hypothetical protein
MSTHYFTLLSQLAQTAVFLVLQTRNKASPWVMLLDKCSQLRQNESVSMRSINPGEYRIKTDKGENDPDRPGKSR